MCWAQWLLQRTRGVDCNCQPCLPQTFLWGDRWVCAGCVNDTGVERQMIAQKCTDAVWAWRTQQLIQCPHALKCPQPGHTGALFESKLCPGWPAGEYSADKAGTAAGSVCKLQLGWGEATIDGLLKMTNYIFFPKVISNCTIGANHAKSSPWLRWFVTAIKPKHLLVSGESSRDIVWSRGLYSIMALLRKPCK